MTMAKDTGMTKQVVTFRLDWDLVAALHRIKERTGATVTSQVGRALRSWVATQEAGVRVHKWCDKIETTQPGDEWRSYRPGDVHASIDGIKVPVSLAAWLVDAGIASVQTKGTQE